MATTGSSIRTYLLTKSAITDLIGTRLRPSSLAQSDSLPAMTYQELWTNHTYKLSGAAGIEECLLELVCFATTRTATDSLADIVRQQLQGYRGTAGSVQVISSQLDDSGHGFDPPADDSDNGKYRASLRFMISVTETIPTF